MVTRLRPTAAAIGVASAIAMGSWACSSGSSTAGEADRAGEGGVADASRADVASSDGNDGDAGADVNVPEAGGSYCSALSPRPKFCDDFDDGEVDFGAETWAILTENNGTAALVTEAKSPPYAFSAKSIGVGAGEGARLHLRASIAGLSSRVTLSFSVFLPKVTFSRGQIGIAALDVADNHFFTLFLRDDDENAPGPTLEETGPQGTTRHVLSAVPQVNAWSRVTIALDLAAGSATVAFDAIKALDGAPIQSATGSEATIRIGAAYVDGPADPFEARFDDVVVDF